MKIQNPILRGFNPDPSLLNADGEYYIATSTFAWYPGVPIYHSKDLVNWELAGHALDERIDFDLAGMDSAAGIWAPNLTYDNGTFYLLYTIVYTDRSRYKDTHNFLITAKDVRGPWSKPVKLNKTGFDPSLFHAPDGKKWVVNMKLDYRLDHERFGGVLIQEYDEKEQKLVGEIYNIFTGSAKGKTEGPNIFYENGYYYLVTAEGGTGSGHCTTICRSKALMGPYEPSPYNPLITSVGGDDVRLKRAGHSQIIKANDGSFYLAHLCSRPVDSCSILGRETAIQNVEYTEDGWFKLSNNTIFPSDTYEVPGVEENVQTVFREDFSRGIPGDYITLAQSREKLGIGVENEKLVIEGGNSLSSKYFVSYLARRQTSLKGSFEACMHFVPTDFNTRAGITNYYNYDNYFYAYLTRDDDGREYVQTLVMENKEPGESERIFIKRDSDLIWFKVEFDNAVGRYYYSLDGKTWNAMGQEVDMRIISDEKINGSGFTGATLGMCAQDLGGQGSRAIVEYAEYTDKER